MFPTILAWIGIFSVVAWAVLTTFITYHYMAQYRQLMLEGKKPPKLLIISSCSLVISGFINLFLCILILILDFKVLVLVLTLLLIASLVASTIVQNKKNKKNPNYKEDNAKIIEESTLKQRLSALLVIAETLIWRIAPFVVYLIVK